MKSLIVSPWLLTALAWASISNAQDSARTAVPERSGSTQDSSLALPGPSDSVAEADPAPTATAVESPRARSPRSEVSRTPVVAVLRFTGSEGVSTEALGALTSRFETELMSTGGFRVVERRNVDAILREQGFQQSGACTTSDCQVEVGQLLGVERIVTGEVAKLGRLWSLSLRMVDVGSGSIVASHVLDIKGSLETVLRGGCPEMAEILAGKKRPVSSRTMLAEDKEGLPLWVWVSVGTAVAGGVAATALLLGSEEGATTEPAPREITVTLETGR